MTDVVDQATRSRMMSGIGGRNTKPEIVVRKALFAAGFRFRLHRKDLPGCPDVVLPGRRVAVFVHGCFWHAHGCRAARHAPATHKRFWREKFARNAARDQAALRALWQAGWQVLVVWECETKDPAQLRALLTAFLAASPGASNYALDDQHALYGLAAETPMAYGDSDPER